MHTLLKFWCNWRKISRKIKCRKVPSVHPTIILSKTQAHDSSFAELAQQTRTIGFAYKYIVSLFRKRCTVSFRTVPEKNRAAEILFHKNSNGSARSMFESYVQTRPKTYLKKHFHNRQWNSCRFPKKPVMPRQLLFQCRDDSIYCRSQPSRLPDTHWHAPLLRYHRALSHPAHDLRSLQSRRP